MPCCSRSVQKIARAKRQRFFTKVVVEIPTIPSAPFLYIMVEVIPFYSRSIRQIVEFAKNFQKMVKNMIFDTFNSVFLKK